MDQADVIYLEVDAEITEAIDKLKTAKSDAVKLVVPARSGLLQSAVNLKLLKKAAKDHDKELAVVTNDKTATFLAAGIGLAVAATVKAKPQVPEAVAQDIEPDIDEQSEIAEAVGAAAVAKKASDKSKGSSDKKDSSNKSSESKSDLENDGDMEEPVVKTRALADGDGVATQPGKKKAKVPNYSSFQKKMWIGAGIVAGGLIAIILAIMLPTAKVTVLAKANKLPISSKFILDTSTTQNDSTAMTYAAQKLELTKDLSQAFSATGKKDVGTKAAGTISLKNCEDTDPRPVPAGAKFVANSKAYISSNAVTVPAGSYSVITGFKCSSAVSVTVTAAANGDSYNQSNATFILDGTSKISGTGSTSGGTTKTIQVVTQGDIDTAKQQAIDADASGSKQALFDKAGKDTHVFEDTFVANVVSVTSSSPVDSENANGTVTVKMSYTVLTASNTTLDEMLDTQAKNDLPDGNQQLYQNGRSDATYTLVKPLNDSKTQMQVVATAYYGQKINTDAITKAVAGKSKKAVTSIVQKDNPSVTATLIDSQPALFPSMPMLSSHIKVQIKVNTN